jgi:hypothetical protein
MLRSFLAALSLAWLSSAAVDLRVVHPVVSDSDGGPANAESWAYTPGQVVYLTCRVSGFTASADRMVRLSYTIQAFDVRGTALAEADKGAINDEVSPQDKEWMPKIDDAIILPPQVFPGTFKIVVKVEDQVAKANTRLEVPIQVRGPAITPSDKLVVANFRFVKGEDDLHALERAAFRPGDHVWAAFDMTGFQYGPSNHMDVNYQAELVGGDGKSLWKQPEPAGEQGDSFYPKPYVSAEMGVILDKNIKPGSYILLVTSHDLMGKQTAEYRGTFVVE